MLGVTALFGGTDVIVPWPIKVISEADFEALPAQARAILSLAGKQGYLRQEQVDQALTGNAKRRALLLSLIADFEIDVIVGPADSVNKTCAACGKPYSLANFIYHEHVYWSHYSSTCHPCRRHAASRKDMLKKKYNISPIRYVDLLAQQGGLCAICKRRFPKVLRVDHCHVHKHVRGLLCNRCNMAIGLLGDDPERLRTAAKYLEDDRARHGKTS